MRSKEAKSELERFNYSFKDDRLKDSASKIKALNSKLENLDKLLKFKNVQPSDDRVTSQGSRAAVKTLDKRKRHEIGTFFWSTFRVTA